MKIKLKNIFPENYRVSAILQQPVDRAKKTSSYQMAGTLTDCYLQDSTGDLVDEEGRAFVIWDVWISKSSFTSLGKEPFIGDKLEIDEIKLFTIISIETQFNSQFEDHYKIGLKLAN